MNDEYLRLLCTSRAIQEQLLGILTNHFICTKEPSEPRPPTHALSPPSWLLSSGIAQQEADDSWPPFHAASRAGTAPGAGALAPMCEMQATLPCVKIPVVLVLDAFEVVCCSPVLGELLLQHPTGPRHFVQGLTAALPIWLMTEANGYVLASSHTPGGGELDKEASKWKDCAVYQAFSRWPAASIRAMAAGLAPTALRQPLQLLLWVVHRPGACIATSTWQDTAELSPNSCQTRVLARVEEVFYGSRASAWPLPCVRVQPLARPGHHRHLSNPNHNSHDKDKHPHPINGTSLMHPFWTADLSELPLGLHRELAVVGRVVELQGSLTTAATSRGLIHQPRVEPHLRVSMGMRAVDPHTLGMLSGTNRWDLEDGHVQLSAAAEERAAVAALRIWSGVRLALGVELAPPPAASGMRWATDFAFASLDIVVALLTTLVSAQSVDEGAGGVALLWLDITTAGTGGGGGSLLSKVLQRFHEAAQEAGPVMTSELFTVVSPVMLSRARPSMWLPSYRVLRTPGCLPSPAPSPWTRSSGLGLRPKRPARGGTFFAAALARECSEGEEPNMANPSLRYAETIGAGLLNDAHGRTLVLPRLELAPKATLRLLQEEVLGGRPMYNTPAPTARWQSPRAESCVFNQVHGMTAGATRVATGATRTMQTVRRVGGQRVPYDTTHTLLASVREGGTLLEKPASLEFAQHMDVVIRPSIDRAARTTALFNSTHAELQNLFRVRSDAWLHLLARALERPGSESFLVRAPRQAKPPEAQAASPWPSTCTPLPKGVSTPLEELRRLTQCTALYGMYAAPRLSEVCGDLLRTYFVAAQATCVGAVDADMMERLVRLTLAHCQARARASFAYYQAWLYSTEVKSVLSDKRDALKPGLDEAGVVLHELATGPPTTALVDAVAAIGLCDSTLHFFTGRSLLGRCVFELLQEEITDAGAFAGRAEPHDSADAVGRLVRSLDRATRIAPLGEEGRSPGSAAFSIHEFVGDLERHLNEGLRHCQLR